MDVFPRAPTRAPSCLPNLDVLIVEDEPVSRRALTTLMVAAGFGTRSAGSAEDALDMLEGLAAPRIVLVDLDLPGMSGFELIRRLQAANPAMVAVLITAAAVDVVENIRRRHSINYLPKPVDFDDLLNLLRATRVSSSN